jgi:hypothetical protein
MGEARAGNVLPGLSALLLAAPLAFCAPAVQSPNAPLFFFVAKTGNNGNSCRSKAAPCLTIQAAIDKVPYEKRAQINVLPGVYEEAISIVGDVHHRIEIYGPYRDEECIDPTQVVVTAPGKIAIYAEDHATAIVGCITVGPATIGIYARQFVIFDVGNTRCDRVAICFALTDRSVVNCGGKLWIESSGSYVATARRGDINFGCQAVIAPGLSFVAFFSAEKKSSIDTEGRASTTPSPGRNGFSTIPRSAPVATFPAPAARSTTTPRPPPASARSGKSLRGAVSIPRQSRGLYDVSRSKRLIGVADAAPGSSAT